MYVNPIPGSVTPERIDQGVDYAGSGNLLAIGDGVVTQVNPGGWGSYGNYIAYKLTSGPLSGREVYYAEGVTPHVKVGQRLSAGQIVASMIPGWHSGIEVGYGSGQQDTSYARGLGGGYTEGNSTAAGQAFSDLIKRLGGPAGVPQAGSVTGTAAGLAVPQGISGGAAPAQVNAATSANPTGVSAAQVQAALGNANHTYKAGDKVAGITLTAAQAAALTSVAQTATPSSAAAAAAAAITGALNGIFTSIVNDAKYAALALLLIVGGFVLLGKGVSRATHAEG